MKTKLNKFKTHCANGHMYTVANTYVTPYNARVCKICRSAAVARFTARKIKKLNQQTFARDEQL